LLALDDEAPAANAPTPPFADSIQDTFSSSMNFDDDENPWIPQSSLTVT